MDKQISGAVIGGDFSVITSQTNNQPSDSNQSKEAAKILKAIVIVPNEKTTDLGSLLAIARSQACKREHAQENPAIRAMVFVGELGVYVAVYQAINHHENSMLKNSMEK